MALLTGSLATAYAPQQAREASVIPFPGTRSEDAGWRGVGKSRNDRDLPAYQHDRMLELSFAAYRTDPLAHRLIEMQVNFVLGNGISVTTPNAALSALIADWWRNDYNNWPVMINHRLRDLYIYGEWLHRPFIAKNGFMYIADLQPDTIRQIVPDVYNHSQADKVVIKRYVQGGTEDKDKVFDLIRRRLDPVTITLEPNKGDLFYFGINRTTDVTRGVGELFPLLDYIDLYDSILFSRAEKIDMMSKIWYDLTIDGMGEREMEDFLKRQTNLPPKSGSVWAHNSQATLEVMSPKLNSDDHAADVRVLKTHITSNAGWPGLWFDDPEGGGRSTGGEMTEAALRNVVNLQATVAGFLRKEIDVLIEQSIAKGTLGSDNIEYVLSFNRPSARDIQRIGPAFARLGQFLELVGPNKTSVMTREEMRHIVVTQIKQLGLSDMPIQMDLPVAALDADQARIRKQVAATMQAAGKQTGQPTSGASGTQTKEDLAPAGAMNLIQLLERVI